MTARARSLLSGLLALLFLGCTIDEGKPDIVRPPGPIYQIPPVQTPPARPGQRVPPSQQPQVPVAAPAVVPPPVSGGTLQILRDGTTAVAADPDRDRVWVADVARGALLNEIAFDPGDEPGRIVEGAAGRVYVALRRGGAVVAIDVAAGKILARRNVCGAPRGLAYDAARNQLHLACAGGELATLEADNLAAPGRIVRLERDLRDVVVEGDTLFVSTFRRAEVLVIGTADGQVRSRMAPPAALNLFRRMNAGPSGPASTRFVPHVAWRTIAKPGGGVLMLHQRAFTGEVPIDPMTAAYGGNNCDAIVQTTVSALVPGQKDPVAAPAYASATFTVDVAVSPDGAQLAMVSPADAYIAVRGSQVTVTDLGPVVNPGEGGCVSPSDTAPPGFAPSPTMPVAFPEPLTVKWTAPVAGGSVRSRIAAEITAVAFSGAGDVVLQSREPAALLIPGRNLTIILPGASRVDTGHALFHTNTGGDIACAACHPEGGEDSHVWNFAMLGARRTQSLRGGISNTLPLHWDGEMRDLPQIMTEVFSGRMGGPMLTSDQAAAAGRFLDAIPALPAPPAPDAVAAERGHQLFSGAAGCSACHSGARYTNNQTVDVGTGRAFQVPSLVGVGARTPLMHNGCAPTVAARIFGGCGGERHASTAGLSSTEQGDLAAFLDTI